MSRSVMIGSRSVPKQDGLGRDRSRRVLILIVGIILLSLGDLVLTLISLKSTGMAEANPIAGLLIKLTQSGAVLAVYKAVTVAICVSLLFRLRRNVEGEVAAWCSVVILALMALQWYHYTMRFDSYDGITLAHRSGDIGADWLVLD